MVYQAISVTAKSPAAGLFAFSPIINLWPRPQQSTPPTIHMIHPIRNHPSPCRSPRARRHPLKKLLLLPAAAFIIACASCGESTPEPPPPVTDTEPVGEGLKVIGYALLGAAVVGVLGRMLR